MCGIAGFVSDRCSESTLCRMGDVISHRGPDETGYFFEDGIGLVNKRLSIVDLVNGKQPAFSEDGNIIAVLNGEIFNYLALRAALKSRGHSISNNSDTAVLPHMYEEYGAGMFEKLEGQFGIALYDKRNRKLVLARDRMGIIPLFFQHSGCEFLFASEIKAILASGRVKSKIDYETFFDVFTYWSPQHDRTLFEGVKSLLPGECLEFRDNSVYRDRYFRLKFKKPDGRISFETAKEEIDGLLMAAVRKRLMGDVKVAAYLSGGLDSSLITSIMAREYNAPVEAFSVGFEDARFDERVYQEQVCGILGIEHHVILFKSSDFAELLPRIIWHAEVPLLRGGPAPLFRLSQLVNGSRVKVVLSGEGSDELFGGYDIFREVKIRDYLKKYPDSEIRRLLFKKVNQFSDSRLQSAQAGSLGYFYLHDHEDGLFDSHYTRWRQFGFFERFFSDNVKGALAGSPGYADSLGLDLSDGIRDWSPIQKSQFLEMNTFLSRYLLSSQGDRMSMANSIEVRFPFLDDDLVQYSMALDDKYKIRALREKYILKKIARKYLPDELINRKKFPYRSPVDVNRVLCDPYMKYMLSDEAVKKFNLFNPLKVKAFLNSITQKDAVGEREIMLFMGILTSHILCSLFNIETADDSEIIRENKCIQA